MDYFTKLCLITHLLFLSLRCYIKINTIFVSDWGIRKMIGKEIKKYRKLKGLTLEQTAGAFMSISRLSNIENDKTPLDPKTWNYLKEQLDLPDDLLHLSNQNDKTRCHFEQALTYVKAKLNHLAVPLFQSVYEKAEDVLDYRSMGESAFELGKIYEIENKIPESEHWLNLAIAAYSILDDAFSLAESHMKLGVVKFKKEQFSQAAEIFQHALRLLSDPSSSLKGYLYYNLASVYYKLHNIDHSASFCEKALANLSPEDIRYLIGVYNLQAIIYAQMNMLLTAKEKCLQAKKLSETIHDASLMAKCLHNLGYIASQLSEFGEALGDLHLSLDIKKANNNDQGILRTQIALGAVHYKQGNIKEGKTLLKRSLQSSRKSHLLSEELTCLNVLRSLCRKENLSSDYLDYSFKALSLADRLGTVAMKCHISYELAGYYYELNNTQAYYDMLHECFLLREELIKQTAPKEVSDYGVKQEGVKIRKQNLLLS